MAVEKVVSRCSDGTVAQGRCEAAAERGLVTWGFGWPMSVSPSWRMSWMCQAFCYMWHMLFDLLLALVLRDAGAWMSSAQGRATIRARPRQDRRCRGVRSRFQAKRIILLQRRAQTRQKLRATPRPAHSGRIAAYMCRRARNNRLAATRRGPGLHRLRCRSGGRRWVVRVVPIVSVPSSARDRNARARLLSSPFEDSGVEAPSRQELGFSSFGFDNGLRARCARSRVRAGRESTTP